MNQAGPPNPWDNNKAEHELRVEQYKADYQAFAEWSKSVREFSAKSTDQIREGAQFVEKAAAGIGGLYTTLLAFVFSIENRPLPLRAVIPALFLGFAFLGSFAYLAFIKNAEGVNKPRAGATLRDEQYERLWFFVHLVRSGVRNKRFLLRGSVVALGCAIVTLPLPLVRMDAIESPQAQSTSQAEERLVWPVPDPSSGNTELDQILYSAQVDVATTENLKILDETPTPAQENENGAWLLAALLGIAVFAIPFTWEAREKATSSVT